MTPPKIDSFSGLKALRPAPRRRDVAAPRGYVPDVPEAAGRLAELLGASLGRNRFGEHLALRRWFPEPSASAPQPEALRLLTPGLPDEAADPAQWLFLDTETTGLAGGTGTYAFLVGLAWWDSGGLAVEQFFMRDYSEEHSVLVALAERLAERRVLVTFNGKSFDWPLLETRFRMTRSIAPRAPRAHLDLLHPARHLWRPRLGSVRLAQLERHVLGWDRGADVISELIPQIYFDFVRGGPADPLVPVFRHNQMDLRGLATLSGRILSLLAAPESSEGDALDLYGLSRLLDLRGDDAAAGRLYGRALGAGLPPPLDRAARHDLARLAKRERNFPLANSLWEELCGDLREGLEAYEQLAIYYEHHARDSVRAAELTRVALRSLAQAARTGDLEPGRIRRWRHRLEHRLARLCSKSRDPLFERPVPEARRGRGESNRGVKDSLKASGG
jgi:uncharacterized protein YprB with RNaseH-like and TPR domain